MLSNNTINKIKERMLLAKLEESDLNESFVMASGRGGQKVNKTSSAVRLHHLPTGITIKFSGTRSREANRWLARRQLAETILEQEQAELSARYQAEQKIRRQKMRRTRRQKIRMLEAKRQQSLKKAARRPPDWSSDDA